MGKYESDSLGNRMKEYEAVTTGLRLVPKETIIIRLDGKAFHTFTRGMDRPFDDILSSSMIEAMLNLCKEIPTCVFGYTQSDEITLVLKLPDRVKSQSYMNGKLHKQISLSASKLTNKFMEAYITEVESRYNYGILKGEKLDIYKSKYFKAEFDSRVFNIPEWDAINNIIWRQQDATRNSIESLGQANFSHKQLYKKNCNDIMDMLVTQKGINWNNMPTKYKRGIACYREYTGLNNRKTWIVDTEMPIITQNREWFSRVTGLVED